MAKDLSNADRYCSSVGYFQEVFDMRLEVSSAAYECYNGIIGALSDQNDGSDCVWRTY